MTDRDLDYQDWAEDEARFEAEEEAEWQAAEETSNAELERPNAPTSPETPQ